MATTTKAERFAQFPPYHLLQHDYVKEAEERSARLERIYHMGHRTAWDGKKLLAELLAKHGGIKVADDVKPSLARIFSVILWGELAAWTISAQLADEIDEIEPKMAASSQAFDEARHFYTMRDYLLELGIDIPPIDGFTRRILQDVLETDDIIYKLTGMQLLVESVAILLFKFVAKARVEPVLADMLPFFERDESRHIGLGVLYLPRLVEKLSVWESVKLLAFQMKVQTFITWGTILLRDDFLKVGVDPNAALHHGQKMLWDIIRRMEKDGKLPLGLYKPSWLGDMFQSLAIDVHFPPPGEIVPSWQKAVHGMLFRVARAGESILEHAA